MRCSSPAYRQNAVANRLFHGLDRAIPEALQEDPQDHRARPLDRHRRRVLRPECDPARDRDRYVLCQVCEWVIDRALRPVVANEGQRIDIPDGCVLENSVSTPF